MRALALAMLALALVGGRLSGRTETTPRESRNYRFPTEGLSAPPERGKSGLTETTPRESRNYRFPTEGLNAPP